MLEKKEQDIPWWVWVGFVSCGGILGRSTIDWFMSIISPEYQCPKCGEYIKKFRKECPNCESHLTWTERNKMS